MKIKMQSILAGPDGCADIGQEIEVDSKTAKNLIAGKFAVKVTGGKSRETAMVDPAEIVERERTAASEKVEAEKLEAEKLETEAKSPDSISAALGLLDISSDEDWTAGGKPAVDRMRELTGSTTLSRADIEVAFPEFVRPKNKQENPPGGDDAGPAEKPGGAVRTNKP